MKKTYTVEATDTANGIVYDVRTSDGQYKYFSPTQRKTVRNAAGFKTQVKLRHARERCEEYTAELEAQGYTRELKGVEKDFAEMRDLMDEMGYTPEERRAATDIFVDSVTDRKLTPQDRYNKTSTVSVHVRIMKNTEQDIIDRLDDQPNKAGYIKSLIRADMAKRTAAADFMAISRVDTSLPLLLERFSEVTGDRPGRADIGLLLLLEDFRTKVVGNPAALSPHHLFALAALLDAADWSLEAEEVKDFTLTHVRTSPENLVD